jgi:hypothetical protein
MKTVSRVALDIALPIAGSLVGVQLAEYIPGGNAYMNRYAGAAVGAALGSFLAEKFRN